MKRTFTLLMFFTLACVTGRATSADVTYVLGSSVGDVKPLISANVGPMPYDTQGLPVLSAYKALGIGMIRTHDFYGPLDMPTMYPDFTKDPQLQSSYNFTGPVGKSLGDKYSWSSDQVFSSIVAAGYEPYFRIGDSWSNVKPPANDSQRTNWANAAVEVLRHYREGKWNGYTSSFRYVEIGNEPNYEQFWPAPYTKEDFFKLFEVTAKALRAAFPTLRIGGPAVTQQACMTKDGKVWLGAFLDHIKANSVPFDFLSWHIYSSSASEVSECATYLRQALDSRGFKDQESIASEMHSGTLGLSEADAAAVRGQGKGAAVISASWIKLQETLVNHVFLYRASDPAPGAPADFYGLYDSNQVLKKTGLAFQLWVMATGFPQRLATTATGNSTDLTAMGAADGKGGYAFLIANTSNSARSWSLTLPDGKTLSSYSTTLYTVSDALGAHQISSPGSEISIPSQSVQLALVSPAGGSLAATATATGTANAFGLSAELKPLDLHVGKSGVTYVGAVVANLYYFLSDGGWKLWSGGTLPTYSKGILPVTVAIPILSGMDVRSLGGTQVLVGYGLTEAEMLGASRYRIVHTLPAK
jgi:xylan 1,4-beta-xylosidase